MIRQGSDCTLVGSSYSTHLCLEAAKSLEEQGVSCDVIDLRVISPLGYDAIVASVAKTNRLCVVDGGWGPCGLAGEIIAGVTERTHPSLFKSTPLRLTLPSAPAPTSGPLDGAYYLQPKDIASAVVRLMNVKSR
ncbi:MAG: hypothetical protein HY204_02300 [Nitrospirae bacterium]|nr:hypothetical protein [Nitrospirota bacterium]